MAEPGIDFEQLRTFLAVHQTGTLTGAAAVLGLSQPAISARLAQLERACGTALFTRTARGVRPTSAGAELAASLEEPINRLTQIAAELPTDAGRDVSPLRFGAPSEFFEHRLARPIAAVAAHGIRVEVRLSLADDLLAGLGRGELDLVVSTVRPPNRWRWRTLTDEEFWLVAAPSLVEGIDSQALVSNPREVLAALPRITYDQDQTITRRWWRHVLGTRPPAIPAITVPDLRSVLSLVRAGAGISALPSYLCAQAVANGELVHLVPSDDLPINTLFLAALPPSLARGRVQLAWQSLVEEFSQH